MLMTHSKNVVQVDLHAKLTCLISFLAHKIQQSLKHDKKHLHKFSVQVPCTCVIGLMQKSKWQRDNINKNINKIRVWLTDYCCYEVIYSCVTRHTTALHYYYTVITLIAKYVKYVNNMWSSWQTTLILLCDKMHKWHTIPNISVNSNVRHLIHNNTTEMNKFSLILNRRP